MSKLLTSPPSKGHLQLNSIGCLKFAPIFLFFFFTNFLSGQVVINEISDDGRIELKNLGSATVDVSSYVLCDFPSYAIIGNLNSECGNFMLAENEILTITNFNVNAADGEMGLYINTMYTDPNSIMDYVEWGSSGHERASVAISAGIWTTGNFVPAFASGSSLEYDGQGDAETDWEATSTPTFCTDNSNAPPNCEAKGGTLTGGPFTFDMIGDGEVDTLAIGSIVLSDEVGDSSQWIVTDAGGIILGLPPTPTVVNFDGAGAGNCLIWHLSYDGDVKGLAMGLDAKNIDGDCFDLSNSAEVIRENASGCNANGGMLFGGPFTFDQIGDGNADMIPAGSITLANATGDTSQWVVTDEQGIILGLPPMPSAVNFDVAGAGNCLIWHLSYDSTIQGLEMGMSATELQGCFSLSNSIEVIRENASGCNANGGMLFGGPFTFDQIGDGNPDMIPTGSITLANATGDTSQWVVTDEQGIILGLPPMPSAVDFDGAGAGNCLIWHLSYDSTILGLEMGMSATELQGCFSLSNSIEVIRENASGCDANGGMLFGGPFTFDQIGDGNPDMIPAGSITLANATGDTSQWVVTDEQGIILGLPPMPSAVNFDGAGAGNCLIWHLSYDSTIQGLEMGMSATGLQGCFSLSNSIEVIRENASGCNANGGMLFGGPFTFNTIGDGVADTLETGSITLANYQGDSSQWIVTDNLGTILGLPPMPSAVDFDDAGVGSCFIWHLSYDGGISGLEMGALAGDLDGDCFSLSNSVEVIRQSCSVQGGTITGGPFEFCVDSFPDMVSDIGISGNVGSNTSWLITDENGNILGLPADPTQVDFNAAGPGICLIWNISFEDGLTGLEMNNNVTDIAGCFDISNSIMVTRVTDGAPCITSTDEERLFNSLNIYPNPTTDQFVIEYNSTALFNDGQLEIRNELGQVIQTQSLEFGNNAINIRMDRTNAGTYTVLLISNDLVASRRILISK